MVISPARPVGEAERILVMTVLAWALSHVANVEDPVVLVSANPQSRGISHFGYLTIGADGAIYVTGHTANAGVGGYDLLLAKYTAAGALC